MLTEGPKWKAFEPSRLDNTTSVFVIDGLTEFEVWELGDRVRPGTASIARAQLTPAQVRSVDDLELEVDDDPPRHAAITGWPDDKATARARALELAAKARLFRRTA